MTSDYQLAESLSFSFTKMNEKNKEAKRNLERRAESQGKDWENGLL